jgi:hypothetical protein
MGVQCRSKLTASLGTSVGAGFEGKRKNTAECCGRECAAFTEEIGSYDIPSDDISEEESRSLAGNLRIARIFSVNCRF